MSFFKKLSGLFSNSDKPETGFLPIAVRCNRCGEVIHARVNLMNDLSAEYDDDGGSRYICRKQLMGVAGGERPCFQRIEVELTFDRQRRLIAQEAQGGQFVSE